MQKKYEFTGETKTDLSGRTFRQIRALVPIAAHAINSGAIGGYIEYETNLSHAGSAWVYPAATVGGKYTSIEGGTIKGGTIKGGTIKGGTIKGGTIWGGTIEGGTIKGGTIWGGTIEGGTIKGGTIKGGTIKGGTIKGGTIWGGTIEGGTIEGGTIEGGTIKGGTIKGGTIKGGTIEGGTIEGGTEIKLYEPIFLSGFLTWPVTMTDQHMTIGCQTHAFSTWFAFDENKIFDLAGKTAVTFWKMHKAMLKRIHKNRVAL